MRGTERAESALVDAITRFVATGAYAVLESDVKQETHKQEAEGAYNAFRASIQEARAQFKVTGLEGAKAAYPNYIATIQKAAQEYAKDLSPEAKKIYDLKLGNYAVTLEQESQEHLAREFVKTGKNNARVNVQLSVQEALLNPYDKNADKEVAFAIYNEETLAANSLGVPDTPERQATIDVNSAKKYSAYLRQKLEFLSSRPGDGIFAQKFLQDNENLLTTEDRTAVESKVRAANLKDQAEVYAKEAFSAHPDNPARGYGEIAKIPNPEFQRAALQEFSRIVAIDKQNTQARRAESWSGFHRLLDNVTPGSDNMQSQVEDVRSYISTISDKLNNMGGPQTLKQQMQAMLDAKVKPGKKLSDPAYKAELTRMSNDIEKFSILNIDHSRLSPADSKAFIGLQKSMLKGDASSLKAIRSANAEYYGVIEDALRSRGLLQSIDGVPARNRVQVQESNKALVDMIASEFFDDLVSMRESYNIGAEFKDSSTIANIAANRKLLEEKIGKYADRFKEANPDFATKPGWSFLWFKGSPSERPAAERLQLLEDRKFVAPPRPDNSNALPPTREGREETARRAKRLLEAAKKLRMNTPQKSNE
jgi:hypothetical protein